MEIPLVQKRNKSKEVYGTESYYHQRDDSDSLDPAMICLYAIAGIAFVTCFFLLCYYYRKYAMRLRLNEAKKKKYEDPEIRKNTISMNIVCKKLIIDEENQYSYLINDALSSSDESETSSTTLSTNSIPNSQNLDDHGTQSVLLEDVSDNIENKGEESFTGNQELLINPQHNCPICLEAYSGGDTICWSLHENCTHSFHRDCLVSWLMKHDLCPMCRSDYLLNHSSNEMKHDENVSFLGWI